MKKYFYLLFVVLACSGQARSLKMEDYHEANTYPVKTKGAGIIAVDSKSPDGKHQLIEAIQWSPIDADDPNSGLFNGMCLSVWPGDVQPSVEEAMNTESNIVLNEMAVSQSCWTDDSKYCIFSTFHNNGHSPWNSPVYVLDVDQKKLYPVERLTKPIVSDNFEVTSDGKITVYEGMPDADGGFDFDHPVSRTVTLVDVMKSKPSNGEPPWNSPFRSPAQVKP
jgi:hypothetical protein